MCDLVRNHRLFQKAKRKDPDPASKTVTVQFAAQIFKIGLHFVISNDRARHQLRKHTHICEIFEYVRGRLRAPIGNIDDIGDRVKRIEADTYR